MEFEIENSDVPVQYNCNVTEIPIVDDNITYNDFFNQFMSKNIPCIIRNVTRTWRCQSDWLCDNSSPNLARLRELYGSCDVTIYDCNKQYFNSHKTETAKFSSYIDSWSQSSHTKLKYLKDWHLRNTVKDNFYEVPLYFASDWLNEYLVESLQDDYRFVYMGQTGTWTPFHSDVFSSFSWSVNVCGCKKWVLFPPGEENYLRDSFNNLPFDVSNSYENRKHFEIVQSSGEAVFVPSGWHHQVWNLDNTISINHNWINGCNVEQMWSSIVDNLNGVKREISDCCSMEGYIEHCQLMLNASYGMDFFTFYKFLNFIGKRRLSMLEHNSKTAIYHNYTIGKKHAYFDLVRVKTVLEQFVKHADINELFKQSEPHTFLKQINDFIIKIKQ